jgi:hypothetical protein
MVRAKDFQIQPKRKYVAVSGNRRTPDTEHPTNHNFLVKNTPVV